MDNTKYIALSRQMALWKQMDIVSNNMANMNTSGYKQDDAIFASYLTQTKNAEGFGRVPVYFTQDFGMYKDFKEGAIVHTGNTFDLALQGDAFFAIETPEGERYTRKGQFQLDADGQLVTSEGYAVMSENNEPFFIAPGETEISVAENGEVFTENGVIGRIKTVSFANNQKLLKVVGGQISGIFTGSFVIEKMFGIPGLGFYYVSSINDRDYTMIIGTTIFAAALFVVAQLLIDIAYTIFDPRIRIK